MMRNANGKTGIPYLSCYFPREIIWLQNTIKSLQLKKINFNKIYKVIHKKLVMKYSGCFCAGFRYLPELRKEDKLYFPGMI
jgi:hypothetical protein